MTRAGIAVVVALLLGAAPGCSGDPTVSDTGYTGTWSRGNERVKSIVAIVRVGEEYRFRWTKKSKDGKLEVACDWEGTCEERLHDRKVADFLFKTWMDPESGHIRVEVSESRIEPEPRKLQYVDELVVEPGGKILWSYTIEADGQKFPLGKGPMRSFTKVADAVAFPPPGAAS